MRDTAMVDDANEYTHPFVPGNRTSMDGRVGLQVQGAGENLHFYLYVPERLEAPIMSGESGAAILATTDSFRVDFHPSLDPNIIKHGHTALCDPTQEFRQPGERTNPYICGENGENDCYDMTIISSTSNGITFRLWGTPVTVEVANPKTAEARIQNVEVGTSTPGGEVLFSDDWTEPAVTRDGRLLTGRQSLFPRAWTNPNTGKTRIGAWDLAYSVLPEDAEPCDVTGWTRFHPISHAPYDPEMKGRYGLAAYPFRDAHGQIIPDGADVAGTYPWVDRDGANVFMAGVIGRLADQSETKYPRRCVKEGCEKFEQPYDRDRGYMVGGLWTRGKFVHLDAMINNQDWAVGVRADSHYWVDLYRDQTGADVPVRFGAGRFSPGPGAGPMPPGYTGNANILDSIENLFNYHEHAKPISGGDVVWIMGTGVATDEIVFDDYIDHDAFIVSNMQASITPLRLGGLVLPIPIYHNGELAAGVIHWLGSLAPDVLPPNIPEEIFKLPAAIRLQNGATSLGWDVPDFGLVKGRGSRIEPTAIGGIKGKGFWLDGNNSITYDIREQPRNIRDHDWYISVFVDSRNATNTAQQLIGFSDYSALHLTPDNQLQYLKAGEVIHEFALPSGTGWQHLAFLLTDQNQTVTLYYNGFPLDRFRSAVPLFEMTPGQLKIGNPGRGKYKGDGFRGWIDDFKVLAHDVNPVEACHHARGFLIETNPGSEWYDHAMAHPGWAQEEVRGAAGGSVSSLYTCYHDYSGDYKAHLANLPDGSVLIKDQINFPEGPVAFGAPRPDSSNNPFCLRCHSEESKDGLSMDALEYHPDIMMEDDPRRQPHQPPRRVFGNIPGNWIVPGAGPGSPAEPVQAPPDGLLIDRWILPRGNFQGR